VSRAVPRWLPTASSDPARPRPREGRLSSLLATVVVGVLLWFLPVGALVLGPRHILVEEGLFFGQAAAVTFGGAYAVLAWVAQRAGQQLHWLTAPQMLDGLALAETTPGPLVLVLVVTSALGVAWTLATAASSG
jgi:chromate transporter